MKKAAISFLTFAVAFPCLAATAARAQGRVIDEEIVLMDPTVAAPSKWAAGASLEGWYVVGPYKTTNSAGETVSKGSINGTIPGESIFIAYDRLTLQYSHREGTFEIKQTNVDNSAIVTTNKQRQIEEEVTLRYLIATNKRVSPYVLVGYNETSVANNEVLDPGFIFTYNGTNTYRDRTKYTSGLVGGGAIIAFNEHFGVRADGRLLFTSGVYKRDDNKFRASGSGVGGAATGTLYVNIVKGLNVQAGLKGQVLNGGKNVGAYGRFGMFASAGYSLKF